MTVDPDDPSIWPRDEIVAEVHRLRLRIGALLVELNELKPKIERERDASKLELWLKKTERYKDA